jgi:hypothetical protein
MCALGNGGDRKGQDKVKNEGHLPIIEGIRCLVQGSKSLFRGYFLNTLCHDALFFSYIGNLVGVDYD